MGRERIFPDREGPVSDRRLRHRCVGEYRGSRGDVQSTGPRQFPVGPYRYKQRMRSILLKIIPKGPRENLRKAIYLGTPISIRRP